MKIKRVLSIILSFLVFETTLLFDGTEIKINAETINTRANIVTNGDYSMEAPKPTIFNSTGKSYFAGPESPIIKWQSKIASDEKDEISYPIIGADGTVYSLSNSNRSLFGIASDGTMKFSEPILFNGDARSVYPSISKNEDIYINTSQFYKMDLRGKFISTFPTTSYFYPTINTNGQTIISSNGIIYCLDNNENVIWKFIQPGNSFNVTKCTVDELGNIYALSNDIIISLDSTGKERWKVSIPSRTNAPIVISNGRVYVVCNDRILCLSTNGNILWQKPMTDIDYSNYLSCDELGNIYFGYKNKLISIDLNGNDKWTFLANDNVEGMCTIDKSGVIYFTAGGSSSVGTLYAINSNGSKKWQMTLEGVSRTIPAMAQDGTLYLNSDIGVLYAIGTGKAQSEALTSVTSLFNQIVLHNGESMQLVSPGVYSDGRRIDLSSTIKWSSTNPKILSVNGDKITAYGEGIVEINGVLGDKSISIGVNVIPKAYVDPMNNKDTSYLGGKEKETINYLNSIRLKMGLNPLTKNQSLTLAAQAHSNHKVLNGDGLMGAHYEVENSVGFVGFDPEARVINFGYQGAVGEGIARESTPLYSMKGLIDAPYHRISCIDPSFSEIGIGFNQSGSTVVDYGSKGDNGTGKLLAYPYSGQKDISPFWYDNESPNPLQSFGVMYDYVGYPISLTSYDRNVNSMVVVESSLKDSNGVEIPYYLVDGTVSQQNAKNPFIIPKASLSYGTTYSVYIKYKLINSDGTETMGSKAWDFTTKSQLNISVDNIYFNYNNNGAIAERFRSIFLDTSPIMQKYYIYSIISLDELNVIEEYTREGPTLGSSQNYDMANLPTGKYKLIFKNDSLAVNKKYLINVTNDSRDGIYLIGESKFDLNADNSIDVTDLATLASKYNVSPVKGSNDNQMDFNGDGIIDIYDLASISKGI